MVIFLLKLLSMFVSCMVGVLFIGSTTIFCTADDVYDIFGSLGDAGNS